MENKKPKLRFNGYEEDWKENQLSSIFDFEIPHNSLSRDKLNNDTGEVKDIHYGDVLIKYGSVVDVNRETIPYITGAKKAEYSNAGLKDGDIVFADTAEDTSAGKAIEIQNIKGSHVISGLHTIVARPKENFSPYFLGYNFNSDTYHSQLIPLLQGIKVLSINKSALQCTKLNYPKDLQEQKKIGEFFEELDELICAKEQELEKLKQIKAALLDKMFPNDESDKSNRGGITK